MLVLRELLGGLLCLGCNGYALGLKLSAVVGRNLGDLPLRLGNERLVAADNVLLRVEVLLPFNSLGEHHRQEDQKKRRVE